jgi:hypothetical protein
MKTANSAVIELRDLHLRTDIGTYSPEDTRPDFHILDLTLGIQSIKFLSRKMACHTYLIMTR